MEVARSSVKLENEAMNLAQKMLSEEGSSMA